jgi:hypothetical protein
VDWEDVSGLNGCIAAAESITLLVTIPPRHECPFWGRPNIHARTPRGNLSREVAFRAFRRTHPGCLTLVISDLAQAAIEAALALSDFEVLLTENNREQAQNRKKRQLPQSGANDENRNLARAFKGGPSYALDATLGFRGKLQTRSPVAGLGTWKAFKAKRGSEDILHYCLITIRLTA